MFGVVVESIKGCDRPQRPLTGTVRGVQGVGDCVVLRGAGGLGLGWVGLGAHNCFRPPFLLVEGLLSTPSSVDLK